MLPPPSGRSVKSLQGINISRNNWLFLPTENQLRLEMPHVVEQFSGTAAHPRKKSTPSLVPCASVRPQSGAGQLLIQERSQRRPWCLAPASIPRVEQDSCSSKKEVNTVLGALRQRPSPEWSRTAAHPRKKSTPSLVPYASVHPQSGAGQLLIQERSQHRPWCLGASIHPQSGAGQLLIQERSQHCPWCLTPASIPRVEQDSCSSKKEVNAILGALAPASIPRVEQDSCSSKKEVNTVLGALRQRPSPEWSRTAAHPRKNKYQQRLSYDLLCSLANALLDGTVFEIVNSLKEVQQLEERNLFNQRIRLINENKAKKQEMLKKHKEDLQKCQGKPHNLAYVNAQIKRDLIGFEKRSEEEVKRKDMKIILELDQKVMDQQVMLEKAGVPGFYVTNNPQEIRIQMYLLEYIVRLSQVDVPS
ncbi:Protein DGCR6 [Lamellibrachia satsuma]|nr:Protein DGCR6 [Lamellibrachia satsuma]